jgi:hypothetical protein
MRIEPEARLQLAQKVSSWFTPPVLTKGRIRFALAVAVVIDAVQIAIGPLGWVVVDQLLDVLAMILTCSALGFHMLLLPTFLIELIPVADMLPTWVGCTAAVVFMRKRAQTPEIPPRIVSGPPQIENAATPPKLP